MNLLCSEGEHYSALPALCLILLQLDTRTFCLKVAEIQGRLSARDLRVSTWHVKRVVSQLQPCIERQKFWPAFVSTQTVKWLPGGGPLATTVIAGGRASNTRDFEVRRASSG